MNLAPTLPRFSALTLALAACSNAGDTSTTPAAPSPVASVEGALRDVDVGRDLVVARHTLEHALEQNLLTGDPRDDAELALAAAWHGLGNDDRAVSVLEATLARHGRGTDWERQKDASRLLVRYLTGTDRVPSRSLGDIHALPVAPIARALAKTIPRTSKERADVAIARFGGDESSEKLGTFALDTALRQAAEEACPLCEDLSTYTSSSTYSDWTGLPAELERYANLVAVFYYDRENGIPARYDAYLPLPVAEIEERLLEGGKGFYAVKERVGAPAIVLFAAPRRAQLAAVEGAFAIQRELPKEPVPVDVPRGLTPREIQGAMRAGFPELKACYEALPEPRPAGTLELDFAIDPVGTAKNVSSARSSTMHNTTFVACALGVARTLTFPALGGSGDTTVRYPITLSPDQ